MEGGTTFHFVTNGFDAAYERAVEAAGDDGEVLIAGGASTIRQAFAAGALDESSSTFSHPARQRRAAPRRRGRSRPDAGRGRRVTARDPHPLSRGLTGRGTELSGNKRLDRMFREGLSRSVELASGGILL